MRMRAKLVEIKEALNRMRHVRLPEQGRWLGQVVRGYLAYHAVPTNSLKITSFYHYVVWHWRRALSHGSQKANVSWERMEKIAARWLPPAGISHPWPQHRFLVKHPRWELCVSSARSDLSGGRRLKPASLPGWARITETESRLPRCADAALAKGAIG
jgi:hypothetical protein